MDASIIAGKCHRVASGGSGVVRMLDNDMLIQMTAVPSLLPVTSPVPGAQYEDPSDNYRVRIGWIDPFSW